MTVLMEKERAEIVKYGLELLKYGLTMNTGGNLSIRDRATGHIAIKPSGKPYETLKPEDITVIDPDGKILEGPYKPSSEWKVHAMIYKTYPRACAVVHCHSTCATAMGIAGQQIPLINHELCTCCSSPVRAVPFEMPGSWELAESAIRGLGEDNLVTVLGNHGPVAYGADLRHAFEAVCAAEQAAKTYLIARGLGRVDIIPEAGRAALRAYDPLQGPDDPGAVRKSV